jgi:Protein of unknown function (DUF3775)
MAEMEPEGDAREITLEVDPATVCFLIAKARQFDAKVPPAERDTSAQADEDEMHDVLEDYGDDPVADEIREAINDLAEDEQAELVALTWVGRGDFAVEEWSEALAAAMERRTGPTSAYLLGVPLLGDLLEEGFASLGYTCEGYDLPV